MKKEKVAKLLCVALEKDFGGDVLAMALEFKYHPYHINRLLSGKNAIPKKFLDYLGLVKKDVEYERVK
jgi:hypothetical protein